MVINNSDQIITELQKIMVEKKMQKKELSNKIGISQSALSERFKHHNISVNNLIEICDGLDVCLNISFSNKDDTKLS